MAREVLGEIDLDPATSLLANQRVGAKQIFTAEDGEETFTSHWKGRVFMNPPGGTKMVVEGTGYRSNPALFWSKLMYEWRAGHAQAAIVLGFTIEVLQVTQGEEEFPMLRFPLCIPKRRLKFDVPREEKTRQLQERAQKARAGGKTKHLQHLNREIASLAASEEEIVQGESPPHGNVLVFVPPRDEHYFGLDKEGRPWVAWGGPFTQRFQDVFSRIGYVRL